MKRNSIMWGITTLVVLTTIAITIGTPGSYSQQEPQPTPTRQENKGFDDLSKYAVADYDAPEPANAAEREKRKLASGRYGGREFVMARPHSKDEGAILYLDEIPPPLMPVTESDLIIVGKVTAANAFLSNDKRMVYTELTVRVEQILKNDASAKLDQGDAITTDRAGGFVRYPNGRKLIYEIAENKMLWVGSDYILFLSRDRNSPNYELVTGYELNGDSVTQLDLGRNFNEFREMNKTNFIAAVSNKIAQLSKPMR